MALVHSTDRAHRLVAVMQAQVKLAEADVNAKSDTADRHPCADCNATLRNAIVRRNTLQEVLDLAGIKR